jgi:hypothetical protein
VVAFSRDPMWMKSKAEQAEADAAEKKRQEDEPAAEEESAASD